MTSVELSTAEILLVTRTLKERRGAAEDNAHSLELDRLYRRFERAANVTLHCDFDSTTVGTSNRQSPAR